MKANEIEIGGRYTAKVSGKLTTVRVDAIRDYFAADDVPLGGEVP